MTWGDHDVDVQGLLVSDWDQSRFGEIYTHLSTSLTPFLPVTQ